VGLSGKPSCVRYNIRYAKSVPSVFDGDGRTRFRQNAVKKYRSSFDWATNGAKTLVSHLATKQAANPEAAEKIRRDMNAVDESL